MKEFKVGDEVEIIGSAVHEYSGYPVGTIGKVMAWYGHDYIVTKNGENTRESWFAYPPKSIKKSNRQIRKEKLDNLL